MADTDANKQVEPTAGSRAGGNVQTKGGSQTPPDETGAGIRAGGNVQTKGAGGGDDRPAPSSQGGEDAAAGTRKD